MKQAIQHIHFVGIGGSGMSGIAEVLHNLGYIVSGSDMSDSATLQHLNGLGIRTFVGHDTLNIEGAQVVVTSTAVHSDNPEVVHAKAQRIPVVPRALMLAELMRLRKGIAIAGAHGKTTTTSLVASVLAEGGLDPTFVIGGRLNSAGGNARLGSGEFIVVEADESDASFLNLLPVMAVVTNIDSDHMETYGHDFNRLKAAFVEFLHRMPFYGAAIMCIDSPGVRDVLEQVQRPVITYGFSEDAQVRAVNVLAEHGCMTFDVLQDGCDGVSVRLNLAGEHNVLNALASICVGRQLGIADRDTLKALANFKGVGRRFQQYGELRTQDGGHCLVIDDYGHHPVEMAATLAAARGAYPGRRIVLVFQPHRYSRTRDCFEDFIRVLGSADQVVLTEVYAAGELPIAMADGRSLARALRLAGQEHLLFVEEVAELPSQLASVLQSGDVVLCMGAGSIGTLPAKLMQLELLK